MAWLHWEFSKMISSISVPRRLSFILLCIFCWVPNFPLNPVSSSQGACMKEIFRAISLLRRMTRGPAQPPTGGHRTYRDSLALRKRPRILIEPEMPAFTHFAPPQLQTRLLFLHWHWSRKCQLKHCDDLSWIVGLSLALSSVPLYHKGVDTSDFVCVHEGMTE